MDRKIVVSNYTIIMIVISLLLYSCGEGDDKTGPEIATVKINFTLPNPPSPSESVDGPFCKTGDILQSGDICYYPSSDLKISILDDGTLHMANSFLNANQINFDSTVINGIPVTLIANRRDENSWIIEKIGGTGDSETLDVIVSTDFISAPFPSSEITYNTKHEFAIT